MDPDKPAFKPVEEHPSIAVGCFEAARAMFDQAVHVCRVHAPLEDMSISGDGVTTVLYVHNKAMFRVTQDTTGEEVEVSSEWLAWPPPNNLRSRLKRLKKS
jgi:hypothetical protein